MSVIELSARPTLSRYARLRFDRHSGRYLLLWPERGMLLSGSAARIVAACDGRLCFGEIVAQLSAPARTDASPVADAEASAVPLTPSGIDAHTILRDITDFIKELERHRLIEWRGELT